MNTAIIRLSLILLLGITTGFFLKIPLLFLFSILVISLIMFFGMWYRSRIILLPDSFFGLSTYILFFLLGVFTTTIHLPENQPRHFTNQFSSTEGKGQEVLLLSIKEALKPDIFNEKYIAEVISVNRRLSHGKILLLVRKDSLRGRLSVGKNLLTVAEPEKIPAPLNPHQFDYSRFMQNKRVLRQLKLDSSNFIPVSHSSPGIKSTAENWRHKITDALKNYGFEPEELAIVQALLLGQKQDISAETYNSYAAAGAIHILAVSGLHVGIILFLLNYLLAPLNRSKKTKVVKTLLLISLLWLFAVLAGLSPSVVRAVTMFSFLAVGMQINRRTSSLNSVFLSLMLLLLINPQWIFEVGFQLSYLAVLAILLLQPLLYHLYVPSGKVGKYFWGLLSTTIAAQAGVLPLSLFYFHQFPGLFFLSNLVILPFLGFILIYGILVIFLALIGFLPQWLSYGFEKLIQVLNGFISEVAKQEQFLFRDISFGLTQVLGFYLVLLAVTLLWLSFSYRKTIFLLASIIVLQAVHIYRAYDRQEKLVVFHKTGETIIARQKENLVLLYHRSQLKSNELPLIRNYLVGENIVELEVNPLQNILPVKDKLMVRIDSTGVYSMNGIQPRYLLLSGSPRINLERIIQEVNPQEIIADGSNYKNLVERWKATSEKEEIPFHYTGEKGAFVAK